MEIRGRRKTDNKGSALVVVIIAMAFIGILASVLMYMSLLNYQMKVNNLKVRDFCASAKCSPMTLYRARDPAHPMERDTIVRITEAMKQHLKEIM